MKKVITYGTFDMFHVGHLNMLKRAKEYGDFLIVAVTGENYDIGRGKLSVRDTLAERIENVRKTGLADQIIVEEYLGQKIDDIVKYDIDTFVIGDDWKGKFDHLAKYCNLVYLERTKGISSTMLREENFPKYKIGIITDYPDDNQLIEESKAVSGFSVKKAFTNNDDTKKSFCDKFKGFDDKFCSLEELVEQSDVIYVHTAIPYRATYVRKALSAGKHVICDSPFTLNLKEEKELFNLARTNNAILMEDIKMVYIYVFNQLLWMTQGGLIGDILSLDCSISRNDKNRKNLFYDLMCIAMCPMLKIMGLEFESMDANVRREGENVEFASIDFRYKGGRATLRIGDSIRVKNQIEIIGTKGTVRADGNWWRGNRFEIEKPNFGEKELYCTNYAGNGFKYQLKSLANMIKNETIEPKGVFIDESIKMIEIIEDLIT